MEQHDGSAGTGRRSPGGGGIAALSLPSRIVVAVAVLAVAAAVAVHLGMVFLHVAPANTVSKQHAKTIDEYIYPEFEQNWKLFAPNPLQQNIAVQARAQIRTATGELRTTEWKDLSAQDGAAIRGNLLPSHTQQNELRRAWDFFTGSHDAENRPNGLRGKLSEEYIRRIVMLRFSREREPGTVVRVQVRSATTAVAPPPWSDEKIDTNPSYREYPWWPVGDADRPGTDGVGRTDDSAAADGARLAKGTTR
ncbi:DUF5819 family protein [Streptomyces sp. URMC 123]|uniref:DUF5819 family protein n=1 Tax=Streptomyces sp. URMC 123 TaxID=3423403 RepID=UPI003F1AE0D9